MQTRWEESQGTGVLVAGATDMLTALPAYSLWLLVPESARSSLAAMLLFDSYKWKERKWKEGGRFICDYESKCLDSE